MKTLQGFKTIIFNLTAALAAWLGATYEIELPEEHQAALATTIVALGNILLRLFTKSPVFKKNGRKRDKDKVKKAITST